jgi:hypothetical protein
MHTRLILAVQCSFSCRKCLVTNVPPHHLHQGRLPRLETPSAGRVRIYIIIVFCSTSKMFSPFLFSGQWCLSELSALINNRCVRMQTDRQAC